LHQDYLLPLKEKKINKCIVKEALTTRKWISDIIQCAINVGIIIEFLHLWDILLNLELQPGVNYTHF
jgi:hypothetical protein